MRERARSQKHSSKRKRPSSIRSVHSSKRDRYIVERRKKAGGKEIYVSNNSSAVTNEARMMQQPDGPTIARYKYVPAATANWMEQVRHTPSLHA